MPPTAVILDFETVNPDRSLLKRAGAWRYSEDPNTEILCLVFKIADRKPAYVWAPDREGNAHELGKLIDGAKAGKYVFVSHGEFEIAIWRNIMVPRHYFPDLPSDCWHDTMAVAATKGLPLALENLCEALHLSIRKDMEGRKYTLSLANPNAKVLHDLIDGGFEKVKSYCEKDVEAEEKVHETLGLLPPEEQSGYSLHCLMNRRGVCLDKAYIAKAMEVVEKATKPKAKRFFDITGFKHTQTVRLCKEWGLKSLRAEAVVEELAGDLLNDVQREALEIRQEIGSNSIKKLQRMADSICRDGRARGLSQFHGAQPGRSTGRLWQPYNLPRGTLKHDPEFVVDMIKTGNPDTVACLLSEPPIDAVKSSLRHGIVAAPGHTFLAGDYSGIQLRIALALAGQTDKLELIKNGLSPYLDMGQLLFGRVIDKDKDVNEYVSAKNTVLGAQFGMGAEKFHARFCKNHPFEFAERQIKLYRHEWAPMIPLAWYALKDLFEMVIGDHKTREWLDIEYRWKDGWITARLPSGRILWYRNPRMLNGQIVCDGARTVDRIHGGLLFENVVMGIEVDIQRSGWQACEDAGFPIVMEVYDQLVAEVPEHRANLKEFEKCMLTQPDWVRELGIPVAVECWQGKRYRK